jgi:putative ABC transport system permease protein
MWNPMATFRRWRRPEADFADEVAAHLDLETDRLVAEGWAPPRAAREARRRFGNVASVQERYHERRSISWVEDLVRDVRYAVRMLAKDRAYLFASVSALGLGLAANIALFSLFSAVALKPLPARAPDRLVTISQAKPMVPYGPFSLADFLFYRANSRTLQGITAAQPAHLRLAGISPSANAAAATAGAIAEPVIALFVATNYFDMFGVPPVLGRTFRPDDENATGSFSALLSENYWDRRFSRDPSIIGSTLRVGGIRVTVVGVSPRDFAGVHQQVPDMWVPLAALGNVADRAARETAVCCELAGRLADGRSIREAQAELAALAAIRRRDLPPRDRQMSVSIAPAVSFGRIGEQIRPLFAVLQLAMLLVLLIACANVAGLLLGRAWARHREIAVRLATGASRGRLVRQLVTEGIVVAAIAAALAATITLYGLAAASRFAATYFAKQGGGTVALPLSADGRVLLYVAGISLAAGVVFTLAPALHSTRLDLVSALKSAAGASDASHRSRLRGWLIAGQITVSVALLITAAGLARASLSMLHVDPGFRVSGALTVWLTDPQEIGLPAARAREIEALVRDRVRALPGVLAVSTASRLPLAGNVSSSPMLPAEAATDPTTRGAAPSYPFAFVSENYFEAMNIPLVHGRSFTAQEVRDSAAVAVISDSMARHLWPKGDAIGKRLALGVAPLTGFNTGGTLSGSAEIVGVVRDIRGVTIATPDAGDVYLPKVTNGWNSRLVVVVQGDMASVARDVSRSVREIDPALPVATQTMADLVSSDTSVITARVGAMVLASIGAIGLLLAAVGVSGMVSYAVRQQRREIGIRMALGAQSRQVLGAAMRGSLQWIVGGTIVGTVLGAAGIALANSVLQGVSISASTLDPGVLILLPIGIGGLALSAALLSARRATSIDPAAVLRADA